MIPGVRDVSAVTCACGCNDRRSRKPADPATVFRTDLSGPEMERCFQAAPQIRTGPPSNAIETSRRCSTLGIQLTINDRGSPGTSELEMLQLRIETAPVRSDASRCGDSFTLLIIKKTIMPFTKSLKRLQKIESEADK
jgi:hypothetical protein